jgi:hypothetical protein
MAERTKTRVIRPASNVVQMPKTSPQPAAPDVIGVSRAAVMARLDQIGSDDAALRASCGAMADVLDDPERIAMHVQACKQLDFMLARESQGKKKKSNQGRLAIMNSMNRPGRRTGTAE